MSRFFLRVAALLACAALAACNNPPSSQLRAVILRDGKPDVGAPAATGVAGGALPVDDVSCREKIQGAGKLPGCEFRLTHGNMVIGPYVRLAPGSYDASFGLETPPGCAGGKIQLGVVTAANGFRPLAQQTLMVAGPQVVHLGFSIDPSLADWAPMEFWAVLPGRSVGCVVLSSVKVLAR
jgi:hypothetical protein